MTFKRSTKSDPFKNISLSTKDLFESPSSSTTPDTHTTRSKNGTKYVDLGASQKPARPFSVFMIYTILTVVLALHGLVGLLSVIWVFIEYMSTKSTQDPLGEETTSRIVAFSLNTAFHLFRVLIYFVAIPFGCLARPAVFVLSLIVTSLCIGVDLIVIVLYALDRVAKTDVSKFFGVKLTVQQYVSYLCLDGMYIVVVVFFVLAIVRYRRAVKMHKRSTFM